MAKKIKYKGYYYRLDIDEDGDIIGTYWKGYLGIHHNTTISRDLRPDRECKDPLAIIGAAHVEMQERIIRDIKSREEERNNRKKNKDLRKYLDNDRLGTLNKLVNIGDDVFPQEDTEDSPTGPYTGPPIGEAAAAELIFNSANRKAQDMLAALDPHKYSDEDKRIIAEAWVRYVDWDKMEYDPSKMDDLLQSGLDGVLTWYEQVQTVARNKNVIKGKSVR